MRRVLLLIIILTIAPSCSFLLSQYFSVEKFRDPAMIGTATKADVISEFGEPNFWRENGRFIDDPLNANDFIDIIKPLTRINRNQR